MDLRHLGAVWERLAVAGNARLVGRDDLGIAEDRYQQVSGLTNGDELPVFVSPELGEGEPVRHLHSVLVLRRKGEAAHGGKQQYDTHDRRGCTSRHGSLLRYHFQKSNPGREGWHPLIRNCQDP
jgi:hypothetical protein